MSHKNHFILFALLFIVFAPGIYFSGNHALPTLADTSTELFGYAWSGNTGWISFNSKNCDANNDGKLDSNCGGDGTKSSGSTYSVKRNGAEITGSAWSSNLGSYIYFGPDGSSARNFDAGHRWAYLESDDLKGWARACSVFASGCSGALKPASQNGEWDGWISLNSSNTPGSKVYGVKFNSSNTNFWDVAGCDGIDKPIDPQSFGGCAWGGGDVNTNLHTPNDPSDDTNDSPQVPGWIDFSYSITSCTDSNWGPSTSNYCPGTAFTQTSSCGRSRTNYGTKSSGCGAGCTDIAWVPDTSEYCAGTEFIQQSLTCPHRTKNNFGTKSCGGGEDKCPDGSSNPNPSGVYVGVPVGCPLFAGACTADGFNMEKAVVGSTITWKVTPSGGGADAQYVVVWKDNGVVIPGQSGMSYSKTFFAADAGTNHRITAEVKTVADPSKVKIASCDPTPFSVVTSVAGAQGLSITVPNLLATFQATGNTADVKDNNDQFPVSFDAYPIGQGSCLSPSFSVTVLDPNGVSVDSKISKKVIKWIPPTKTLEIVLGGNAANRTYWMSNIDNLYKVKITSTGVGAEAAACAGTVEVPLRLKKSSTGQFFEQ